MLSTNYTMVLAVSDPRTTSNPIVGSDLGIFVVFSWFCPYKSLHVFLLNLSLDIKYRCYLWFIKNAIFNSSAPLVTGKQSEQPIEYSIQPKLLL